MTRPLVLDAQEVARILPEVDVTGRLAAMFRDLGLKKAAQPPQTVTEFADNKGDFITYLGSIDGAGVFGGKLSPYIVTGSRPIITAWTCLMSARTGQPLLLCDAGLLTTERTAGTTALAVSHLASSDAAHLAIIGSGPVAQAHYRHVKDLRPWHQVTVYSPRLAENEARQSEWRALLPDVTFSSDAHAAIETADVVMLCTSSGTPVIDPSAVKDGALVTSISTNVPDAHEVPPEFLMTAQVYCDYRITTPAAAGDMKLAATAYGWSAQQIQADLAELELGTSPKPDFTTTRYFRSVGLGLEDIAIAYAVYQAYLKGETT